MLMAATVAGVATAGVAASLVGAVSSGAPAEVDMVGAVCGGGEIAECSESRRGHQCSVATNTIIKTESDNSFSDSTTDIKITYIRVTTWSRSHVGKNVPESHVVTEKYDIT